MGLRYLTSGESHGPALLTILEGMPAGLPIDEQLVNQQLARRQAGYGAGPRMKLEHDQAQILSGVMEGLSTGAPIAMMINNADHAKWKGKAIDRYTAPRPGHVDLAGVIKYGYNDIRPALERSSARETAARVVVGAVCSRFLSQFGIKVGGYVVSIGDVDADLDSLSLEERFALAEQSEARCPDANASARMRDKIRAVMEARDTLGGVIEIAATGLPVGLGSHVHFDRRLEARIGAAALSVQAIKGVEFGPAFANTRLPGTKVHDAIRLVDGQIIRPTNRAGGIEGGISTGQPLIVRMAMKPIATTLTPQKTVDLRTGQEVDTTYERSDFCPVPRAVPVLEAVIAFVLADALLEKLGGDSLQEMLPRYEKLSQARLEDIHMEAETHIFWPDAQ